ncbi:hypothetical protein AB0395_33205 [Streptosporangium sp. NPDC051023]|uniref:hypothetical protein n=1 Tax=Streptosporangium sp. NPDC051023 TaxID=3155410 RepID=UPI00344F631F
MPQILSTVPAVLDALVAAARQVLPNVQVLDGQPVTSTEPDVIAVGFTGIPGEAAVQATEERAQMGIAPDRERYDITCLASALRGETDAQAVRLRAFELLEAIRSELRRDPTLGGLVMSARLAVLSLTAQQTSAGAEATVQFIVRIDAFTR